MTKLRGWSAVLVITWSVAILMLSASRYVMPLTHINDYDPKRHVVLEDDSGVRTVGGHYDEHDEAYWIPLKWRDARGNVFKIDDPDLVQFRTLSNWARSLWLLLLGLAVLLVHAVKKFDTSRASWRGHAEPAAADLAWSATQRFFLGGLFLLVFVVVVSHLKSSW